MTQNEIDKLIACLYGPADLFPLRSEEDHDMLDRLAQDLSETPNELARVVAYLEAS